MSHSQKKFKLPKLLSVVVPAYRQERTIAEDLKRIESAVKDTRVPYEIICVVDGLIDKTFDKAKKVASSKIKIVAYTNNRGKGHAVRFGISRAKGDYIAFIDAGMEIDPTGVSMLLEHLKWYNADIVIASKRHPVSQTSYPFFRKIISKLYQLFVKFFAGLNVTDTQVGLKIFRKKVLQDVLPRLVVKRYAFDLEMLTVANYLGYTRIYEAPVKINYNFEDLTHAATINSMFGALIDTIAIIYRLRIIHYYDDSHSDDWRRHPDLEFWRPNRSLKLA